MPSDLAWSTDLRVTSWFSRTIRPEVGRWNPHRILSRVDLPAPLSPRSPSTSPRFRCRFTSVSAVTAPYLLVMCSQRRTSPPGSTSSAWPGVLAVMSALSPFPQLRELYIRHHGDEDRRAEDDEQRISAHTDEREPVEQDAQHHRAEEGANDGSHAPQHRRAADHRRGDRVEHPLVRAQGGGDVARVVHLLQADEGAEQPGDHEVAVLDPADVDTGLPCPEEVPARGDRVDTPAGPGQHDMEDRGEHDRPGDRRPRVIVDPLADAEHVRRDLGRLVVGGRVDEPQQDEPGAQRRDERGHADSDREEAVDEADHHPEQQREEDREQAWEAVEVGQEVQEIGGEPDDEADRQVDLAADQQEDLAQRDDGVRCHVIGPQRDLVRLRGEVRSLVDREVEEQRYRDHEHGRLALSPEHEQTSLQQAAHSAATSLPALRGAGLPYGLLGCLTHWDPSPHFVRLIAAPRRLAPVTARFTAGAPVSTPCPRRVGQAVTGPPRPREQVITRSSSPAAG